MEKFFNKNQITSITITDKIHWPFMEYVERRRYVLFGEIISGFLYYDEWIFDRLKSKNEIEQKMVDVQVVDNKTYLKPNVVIELSSGTTYEEYFNTIEEAEKYGRELRIEKEKKILIHIES